MEKFVMAESEPRPSPAFGEEKGVLSVVNSKNCMRLAYDKSKLFEVLEKTLNADELKGDVFLRSDSSLLVPREHGKFQLKNQGNKAIIYSASLVREFTKKYQLDFDGKTCLTFRDFEIIEFEGCQALQIKMIETDATEIEEVEIPEEVEEIEEEMLETEEETITAKNKEKKKEKKKKKKIEKTDATETKEMPEEVEERTKNKKKKKKKKKSK